MDASEQADPSSSDSIDVHQFAKQVGIVIGLTILAGFGVALLLESVTVFFLLFAAILWAVFLRGISEFVAEHSPLPVTAALAVVVIGLLGLAGGVGYVSGPNIADQMQQAAEMFPKAVDEIRGWVATAPLGGRLQNLPDPAQLATPEVGQRVLGIFAGALGVAGNTLLIVIVGLYLAVRPDHYKRGLIRLFPMAYRDRASDLIEKTSGQLGWWIAGRLLSMAIVALLTAGALAIMGIPLAFFLGLLSGLLAFVPIIGPIVAAIPAMMVAALQSPIYVVYVAILYFAVQGVENYLIMPVVSEKVVDIPPALLLMAQVLIGLLTGLFGLILATPILVMVMVWTKHAYIHDVLGERGEEASA